MSPHVLAQDFGTGALQIATPVGVAVLISALAGAVLALWLRTTTRPSRVRSDDPTMDLRSETPAVVGLLTNGFRVDDATMPATVVDLAARGWFTIDDIGGGRIVLHLRSRTPDEALTAYEERVLRHIRTHATDGVVPAPALTLGPEGVSERWFRGFARDVTAHGRELGLCRRRWDLWHVVLVWVAVTMAAAPALAVASRADRTADPTGWGSIGNLLTGIAVVIAAVLFWFAQRVTRSRDQVDTPAGREATAHWRGVRTFYRDSGRFEDKPAAAVAIWERPLAYATALGLAPVVQRQIPFETEHDRHAWSLATGHWRRVEVVYRAPRPGWGEPPWWVVITGVLRTIVAGALAYAGFYVASTDLEVDAVTFTDDQRRIIGLVGLIIAIAMSMVAAVSVVRVLLGLSDLFARRTIEGELVRRRERRTGHWLPRPAQWVLARRSSRHMRRPGAGLPITGRVDDRRRRRWYLAVDPGEGERIRALRVRRHLHDQVRQSARVRLTHTPRVGYVTKVEMLTPPRPSAADGGDELHPLAGEALGRALSAMGVPGAAGGGLAGALDRLETMTDADGRPILDQVDDEGVTLRERIAAGEAQLQALRDDQALDDARARTPLLGQILDTLTGDGRSDDHARRNHGDTGARDR